MQAATLVGLLFETENEAVSPKRLWTIGLHGVTAHQDSTAVEAQIQHEEHVIGSLRTEIWTRDLPNIK
jgi:hypothetical protein